jgi:spore maturation protein CgeB
MTLFRRRRARMLPPRAPVQRVLLLGNVTQQPYCNNLLPIVRAFEMEAQVRVLEPYLIPSFTATGGALPAEVPVSAIAGATVGFAPEVVVGLAGGLFLTPAARAALPDDTVLVGLAMSDPLGLDASMAIAPSFDLFYSQDPHALPLYADRGLDVRLCEPAVGPDLYRPVKTAPTCDVLFVGKWTPHRDELVTALARGATIRVHTSAGETRWSVPARGPLNTPRELAEACSGARVVLEVALVEQPGNPLDGTCRITNRPQFAAACGTPSLIESYDELPRFFQAGREIITYTSVADVESAAALLLGNEKLRRAVARRARRRVIRQHTWSHRVRRVLGDAARMQQQAQRLRRLPML